MNTHSAGSGQADERGSTGWEPLAGQAVPLIRLADTIKGLAGQSTADLVGIAPVEQFSAEEFGELGRSFGPIRSIIVLAQHIVDPVQMVRFFSGCVHAESPMAASFGDSLLRNTCWTVVDIIGRAGFKAAIPRNLRYGEDGPTHRISYKKAGVLAGLGAFGRNQLLLHPEWGPWMWLRAVITDAVLPTGKPIEFSPCEGCGDCLTACPHGALTANGIDREACRQAVGYVAQTESVIRLSPHGQINCDKCMRACPVGTAPPRLAISDNGQEASSCPTR